MKQLGAQRALISLKNLSESKVGVTARLDKDDDRLTFTGCNVELRDENGDRYTLAELWQWADMTPSEKILACIEKKGRFIPRTDAERAAAAKMAKPSGQIQGISFENGNPVYGPKEYI